MTEDFGAQSLPDGPYKSSLIALSYGEEYPGSHDCYKETLIENGWDVAEVNQRFGRRSYDPAIATVSRLTAYSELYGPAMDSYSNLVSKTFGFKEFDFKEYDWVKDVAAIVNLTPRKVFHYES
jgi:hypothetical protein